MVSAAGLGGQAGHVKFPARFLQPPGQSPVPPELPMRTALVLLVILAVLIEPVWAAGLS
ncbi:MAG: hypothetical protein ACK4HR_07575 [Hyphomonas sp.]|jgi:hypothetical protein